MELLDPKSRPWPDPAELLEDLSCELQGASAEGLRFKHQSGWSVSARTGRLFASLFDRTIDAPIHDVVHNDQGRVARPEARVRDLERRVASLSKSNAVLVEQAFGALVDVWLRDTEHLSSITEKVTHPAYRRIIDIGPDVLPHIFKHMDQRPGHWHSALAKIIGTIPPTVAAAKTVSEGCVAWIAWAREQGHKW